MGSALVVLFGICSIIFMVRAVGERSPGKMWGAALFSLLVSFLGMFTIGGFIFLATALQLAAAIAFSRAIQGLTLPLALLIALASWVILVPAQFSGAVDLGAYDAFVVVGVAGLFFALLLMLPQRQRPT